MGKKRAVSIRRIAEIIIERHPNGLTSDFEENKRLISEVMRFPSKATRNKVAGYISRITQNPSSEKARPEDEEEKEEEEG